VLVPFHWSKKDYVGLRQLAEQAVSQAGAKSRMGDGEALPSSD
jgi:hypothetical protein